MTNPPLGELLRTVQDPKGELNRCLNSLALELRIDVYHDAVDRIIRPTLSALVQALEAPTLEVRIAETVARVAHFGQTTKSEGKDYITHPEAVAALLPDDLKAAGWLHDVLEDSEWIDRDCLLAVGVQPETLAIVEIVSRDPDDTYQEFIDKIATSGHIGAIAVKLADLQHNLRPSCPESLRSRYLPAVEKLQAALAGQALEAKPEPSKGQNEQAWEDLRDDGGLPERQALEAKPEPSKGQNEQAWEDLRDDGGLPERQALEAKPEPSKGQNEQAWEDLRDDGGLPERQALEAKPEPSKGQNEQAWEDLRDDGGLPERQALEAKPEPEPDIEASCAICGWPLAEFVEQGCVRGNCSQRPWPDRFYDPERADREYHQPVSEKQKPLPAIVVENQQLRKRAKVADASIADLERQLTEAHVLTLNAYASFIKGVDITNTMEAAREVLVRRAVAAEARVAELERQLTEARNERQHLRSDYEILRRQLTEAQGELRAVDSVLDRRDAIADFDNRVDKILHCIKLARQADPKGEIGRLEQALTAAQAERDRLQLGNTTAMKALDAACAELQQLREDYDVLVDTANRQAREVEQLREAFDTLTGEKFSDRTHVALKARTELAEREAQQLREAHARLRVAKVAAWRQHAATAQHIRDDRHRQGLMESAAMHDARADVYTVCADELEAALTPASPASCQHHWVVEAGYGPRGHGASWCSKCDIDNPAASPAKEPTP